MFVTGSPVVMGLSLGLGLSPSLPVEEARASSGMGFEDPKSLEEGSVWVSTTGSPVVMDPSLGLGHPLPFPRKKLALHPGWGSEHPGH